MKTPTPFQPACGTPLPLLLSALLCAAALTGCANRWSTSFEPAVGATGIVYPPTQHVTVRQVPWARLVPTLDGIQERLITTDVHPSEWSDETRREVQTDLLLALQFEPTDDAEVFGVSSFSTTDDVRPESGELATYARSIGADYVVWADRSLGLRDTIVREPVQTSGVYGGWGYGRRSRGHGGLSTETVWVPVVVERENIAFLAFYVRTGPTTSGGTANTSNAPNTRPGN